MSSNQNSSELQYYNAMKRLTENALLHLYGQVESSDRKVTTKNRNQILIRWLKPLLNRKEWIPVKKEIKLCILVAREKNGALEQRLIKLAESSAKHKLAGGQFLYYLLNHLYDEYELESRLCNESESIEPNIFYMPAKDIENAFQGSVQIAPISLRFMGDKMSLMVEAIHKFGGFDLTTVEVNDNTEMAQFHLMRSSR